MNSESAFQAVHAAIRDADSAIRDMDSKLHPKESADPVVELIYFDVSGLDLDAIAKEVPQVAVLVMVYKTIITLESMRRKQDKRVAYVYNQVTEMMRVLSGVTAYGLSQRRQDEDTPLDRLRIWIPPVIDDLKAFANSADAYYRRRSLAKIMLRSAWVDALTNYYNLFGKHKNELRALLMFSEVSQSKDAEPHFKFPGMKRLIEFGGESSPEESASVDLTLQPQDVASPEVAAMRQALSDAVPDEHSSAPVSSALRGFTSALEPRIWRLLESILSGAVPESALLDLSDADVQFVLDAIQQITDSPSHLPSTSLITDDPRIVHRRLRRLLLKLALKCGKLPTTLFVTQVECSPNSWGAGGFADIYQGTYNGSRVALKRLRVFLMSEESRRPEMLKAFYHECLLWRNLSHKHVLPIIGIDNQLFNGVLCMIMPWMEHGSVRSVIDSFKTQAIMPPEELRRLVHQWMKEIVKGLTYLHEEGVAHGDLRGVNVLVDSNWSAHLADFGLAVFADGASNEYGSMRGGAVRWLSPELIDPEQFGLESSRPTYASDVYSFACVCMELYTSQAPFSGWSDGTVLVRVLSGVRPKRPAFHGGDDMPDALWSLLNQCWAQSPSERPLSSDLVRLLDETHLH